MITLGIETSCDETAAAIVKDGREVLSNLILSQVDLHKYFGGVIPELASRKHIEVISGLVKDALQNAGIKIKDVGLIAVTQGPGLVGALLVGLSYAKALSYSLKVPLIGVNHIEAHLYSNFFEYPKLTPPCIGLIVSGGHSTLVKIKDVGDYKIMGQTQDDAAGEAFDKVAKLLGLGYPGGPLIDKMAKEGNPKAVRFPVAMSKHKNYDFSFSGLKTSVVYYVKGYSQYAKIQHKNASITTADLVSSFQEAVIKQLLKKTAQALNDTGYKKLILGGGVARNSRLRRRFQEEAGQNGWELYIPSPIMCTDNAAMIAGLGYTKFKTHGPSPLDIDAVPRLGLE